jgi:serine/threonine protein kinase
MFRDLEGALTAKLSDFGHAAISSEADRIRLPRIQPFNAPEHHHRPINIKAAISQDIFAFGMTCLFVLFHDKLLASRVPEVDENDEKRQLIIKQFNFLESENQKGIIAEFALTMVERDVTIALDLRSRLKEFFASTLNKDPNQRLLNWKVLHSVFNREL